MPKLNRPLDIPQWAFDEAYEIVPHEEISFTETVELVARAKMDERSKISDAILDLYALLDAYMWHRPKNWTGSSWYGDCIESAAECVISEMLPDEYEKMSQDWTERLRSRAVVKKLWSS